MKNYEKPDLILASESPRRKYLLEKAGLKVKVIPSRINESEFQLTSPKSYVSILSQAKAREISNQNPDCWVLGADTIVVINDTVIGKPKGEEQARLMLQTLSGQKHQVLTGFTLSHHLKKERFTDVVATDVYFKRLSADEIDWYIATGEPFDKAGAYAIQGIGSFIVKKINGSYTNVVGLPVCEVIEFLIKKGISHRKLNVANR
jgi:septum formation protein